MKTKNIRIYIAFIFVLSFIFIFIAGDTLCFASKPVLFFSDLTSGPNTGWNNSLTKGAAVTIYGLNFGSAGGVVGTVNIITDTETTKINDSDPNYIAEWGATDNNSSLASNATLERITFFLNSSMSADSTAAITVTVNGITSNSINFGVRTTGDIWYVDDDGNNGNNGETDSSAWATLAYANCDNNANVNAGDIVYIRSGTYSTLDAETSLFLSEGSVDGTSTNPIAYVGYPTEWPNFDFSSYSVFKCDNDTSSGDTRTDYITFAKLQCTGKDSAFFIWSNGFRLVGCDFVLSKSESQYTYLIRPIGSNFFLLGNRFTGGGYDDYGHHVYVQAQVNAPNSSTDSSGTIAYNEVSGFDPDGKAGDTGSSIFNFRPNDTSGIDFGPFYLHHNYIHDNPGAQIFYYDGEGSTGSVWKNFYFYNNLCTNNMTENVDNIYSMWLRLPVTFYIYNNTFYNCESDGGNGGALFHVVDYGAYEEPIVYMSNNIIYKSSAGSFFSSSTAETGCVVVSSNDIYYPGTPKTDNEITYVNKKEVNPNFVDISSEYFELRSNSPAIDEGISSVSSIVTNDLIGNIRPRYSKDDINIDADYDIGAYEYTVYPPTTK